MKENRIQFNIVVKNQFPEYVRDEYPLTSEFFSQYYKSLEYYGAPIDIIENIDEYVKPEVSTKYSKSTVITTDISAFDTTIFVDSTEGFPSSYGLLKIDDEIITYVSKTFGAFEGCIRGFSGITSFTNPAQPEELIFSESSSNDHSTNSTVQNLSVLFLDKFFEKLKSQIAPGFEKRNFYSDLNQGIFVKQLKDFYGSRGTDNSFKILFKALYNENVDVIKPKDNLIRPSDADYGLTKDIVVEAISGDPSELRNSTLYQYQYQDISYAYGPVSAVEKISTGITTSNYYKLSFDANYNRDINVQGSIFGDFTVHPYTKNIGEVYPDSTFVDVDSTVRFPNSGELTVTYDDGTVGVVSYTSKSLTQFFGCQNIIGTIPDHSPIGINTYASGFSSKNPNQEIKVRITAVLDNLNLPNQLYHLNQGDEIVIKSLGGYFKDKISNNWLFNIAPTYNVDSIEIYDISDNTYKIKFKDKHSLRVGDTVTIKGSAGSNSVSTIVDVYSQYSILVKGQGTLSLTEYYTLTKNITKIKSPYFSSVSYLSTNVQNVYRDNQKLLVASASIPYYTNQNLEVTDTSIVFSGTFNGSIFKITQYQDHGFYSGDAVYYTPQKQTTTNFDGSTTTSVVSSLGSDFVEGIYFVKRIDENNIQLSRSRSNIFNGIFLSTSSTVSVSNNRFDVYKFKGKSLNTQKLLREIAPPINDGNVYETFSGKTGILINGVEILNYKSPDTLYYGPINNIEVVSGGQQYDVINPPLLSISDAVGSGATGYCAVSGSLSQIRLIDAGFNYLDVPQIRITGGNGKNAKASVNVQSILYKVTFNSNSNANLVGVGTTISTIGFGTYHKFLNGEKIFYRTNGQQSISGLSTDAIYYVSVKDPYTVTLHTNPNDAIVGSNKVSILSYGIGNHSLESFNNKSIVSSINIINPGTGYENKKRTTTSSGINTSSNTIYIENHGYESGEIVTYNTDGIPITGLTTNTQYYVTKIDNNNFRLSNVGITTNNIDFFYTTKQYVSFVSFGSGIHVFNYPDISVEIIGNIGISSVSSDDFKAKIQPIFRGEITSIHLSNNGVGYGSSEVLNFYRDPEIKLLAGQDSQLTPVVSSSGQIKEVLINNNGTYYYSPPDLEIIGNGRGAVLTPIVENGQIKSIKVISGGIGYIPGSTFVNAVVPGNDASFKSKIKSWTVNLFKRYYPYISGDDGVISDGLNENYGLQYTHLYAPRKLREILYSSDQSGTILYSNPDLKVVGKTEINSLDHSPIIGWAYDGNPIYGPYGYLLKRGGSVTQMKSGYKLKLSSNRPSVSVFPEEFFIEDFVYEQGDESTLDENNARYCVTPEFPNGVYAYFATFNPSAESIGAFSGYKKPAFPYLIGKNYISKPNQFNFKKSSNQDDIDLNETNWIRNTYPYNLREKNSQYDYINIPNKLNQTSVVKYASPGSIQRVAISTGGNNYQIDDRLIILNEGTGGIGGDIRVSKLSGKNINTISVASSTINNIEFYPLGGGGDFILFSPNPHSYQNSDIISVSGLSTTSSLLQGSFFAGITTGGKYVLNTDVGTVGATGLVTYFNVSGNLSYPNIRENDILGIENEQVKVLNIDKKSSRLRVLRAYNNVSSAHSSSTTLYEAQRKISINVGYNTSFDYKINNEIYFNPSDSLGIGSFSGVGIGYTIIFSNPGAGYTQIFVPTRSVYLPNHQLQTGDKVIYSLNGGSPIQVLTNGITSLSLSDQSILYVAKITEDLIGVSTVKVGLGTTGTFVGTSSTTSNSSTLYFTGIGTGVYHSFKTSYPNVVNGTIQRNLVTVSTAETHGLLSNDEVYIEVNPSIASTVVVSYNDYNRRILINPKYFTAIGINTITDNIIITNHEFYTGQKVIHNSTSPYYGLVDNGIYYAIYVDDNTFGLANTYQNAISLLPTKVNISNGFSGSISAVNPRINVYKNSTVTFDLSDSSLSFSAGSEKYSAFTLNFYKDSNFTQLFESSTKTSQFEVIHSGQVGISSDAKVTLSINDNIPQKLYYKLDPINLALSPTEKNSVIVDNLVDSNNEIDVVESNYNGRYNITVTSNNSFTYNVPLVPEAPSYISSISALNYQTTSTNAYGPISNVIIKNGGKNYFSLPGISTYFVTDMGTGAILEVSGENIGTVRSIKVKDIGFDYPSDLTLKPTVQFPSICKIDAYASLDNIGIASFGRGYSVAPKLILLDGKTKQVVPEVDLRYNLGDGKVTILKNTYGINNTTPRIVPIQNSNGVGISTLTFNSLDNTVAVTLSVGFSTAEIFPFSANEKVYIENVSVGVGSTGKGYNSENYGYQLFTVKSVAENRGGIGIVTYSLDGYLNSGEIPGNFDPVNSSGKIISEKNLPKFNISLKSNNFLENEVVTSISSTSMVGNVQSWNPNTGILKIKTSDDIYAGDTVKGYSSSTIGKVTSVEKFDSYYNLNYYSKISNGWKNEIGFLNDSLQRISDNEYYQIFSYSLKSKIDYDTWNDVVSTLNHTAGFRKFSDLQMESSVDYENAGQMKVGLPANSPEPTVIVDIQQNVDTNCVYDYDLVRENVLRIESKVFSDQIIFSNRILTDYSQSIGNRVLLIDDISDQFNSNPRIVNYAEISRTKLTDYYSRKFIILIRDKIYTYQRQLLVLTTLHDSNFAYINQYARVESSYDMGSFDIVFDGLDDTVNFYPTKYTTNDYDVISLSYDIGKNISGIGSTTFGDIVNVVSTSTSSITVGSACNVVSLASTYTSVKGIINLTGNNGEYALNEFSIVRNGSQIEFLEYGQLTNESLDSHSSASIGTFYPYISGSVLKVDFIPNTGIGVTINTIQVAIGNTLTSTTASVDLQYSRILSNFTSISSSPTPSAVSISSFTDPYSGGYYVVQASDLNSGNVQLSEVMLLATDSDSYITEFANLETSSGLGTIGSVQVTGSTQLTFTPIANKNIEVRVFGNLLKFSETSAIDTSINFTNAAIDSKYSVYRSSATDLKRSFNLTHDSNPIFVRSFDQTGIDTNSDTFALSNHYFVSGEELVYTNPGAGTSLAIGIGTTTITGIGLTDKLPSSVYAVKISESAIKLAQSATNALNQIPVTLDITSTGVGGTHYFTSKRQNSKVIIAIDNIIQSPIVSTAITSSLLKQAFITDDLIYFAGITSFFGGDLIKVDDEIMQIRSVGIGSTNAIQVQRSWMGTVVVGHSTGSLITKIAGNYNIVGNKINFVEAPYGKIPLSTTTNSPDSRDWIGITTSSTFHGRSFMRSGISNGTVDPYTTNYIFDDISPRFTGRNNAFTLKSNGSNVAGFSTDNAIILINDVFQGPGISYDYNLVENTGISSITFTGAASSVSYDPNTANIPLGGILVSVGSTNGFGYQPLVSAGGTSIVSVAGTIRSISIGNSGSGYRSGAQTVRVGIATSSLSTKSIFYVGIASISKGNIVSIAITNPGIGYTSSNPPYVIIDAPLSYSNIPLIYSSTSTSGLGTAAKVDIVVGQGSSVIDFELSNLGYGYGQGETLTVAIGGTVGIPTVSNSTFREFKISVDKTYSDKFSGWSIGQLQVLDDFNTLFDGVRKTFQITLGGQVLSIRSAKGSNIDIKSTLLIFINGVLQIPGIGYYFDGGSLITFSDSPKSGDTSKILFYKGTGSVDVIDKDILETVKIGDELTIGYDPSLNQSSFLQEDSRSVIDITAIDTVDTNVYYGPGNTTDEKLLRPVTWCRQTEDKIINEKEVAKDRNLYEPLIYPVTNIIQPVSTGTTTIYVESLKSFFDPYNENNVTLAFQNNAMLISQENNVSAAATAIVSIAGTISSVLISDGGVGYTTSPTVKIGNTTGIGSTSTATSTISAEGTVTSITVSTPGFGYTSTNPPVVLIESPKINKKQLNNISYIGDFGLVVGIASTSVVGIASTALLLNLYIEPNSVLTNTKIVGTAITISQISTGDYFVLSNTNISFRKNINSLSSTGSVVGVGTTYLDNVYQVISSVVSYKNIKDFGQIYTKEITVSIDSINNYDFRSRTFDSTIVTFDSTKMTFDSQIITDIGNFSWGKINSGAVTVDQTFNFYNQNGITGIKTSALLRRVYPLKYRNYVT